MTSRTVPLVAALLLAAFAAVTRAEQEEWAGGMDAAIPDEAAAAIKEAFPKAVVRGAEVKDEDGVKLYEVKLEREGSTIEVEITPDGDIVQVEEPIAEKDLPKPVADAIAKAARGASVGRIEKGEKRAIVRQGILIKLASAKVVYEATLHKPGMKGEIQVSEDGTVVKKAKWQKVEPKVQEKPRVKGRKTERLVTIDEVPAAVKEAILKEAGDNEIQEIEEVSRALYYQVEWRADGKEVEVKIGLDGEVLGKKAEDEEDEKQVTIDQVPEAVKATILKQAGDNKVEEIEQVSSGGKVTHYEAEWTEEGKEEPVEIRVAPDGKLLGKEVEEEEDEPDEADDRDEDE